MKANEQQETEAWKLQRAGSFTASRASDLMARTKSGPAASRSELITLLAIERLTGFMVEGYRNAAMARGIELESEARDVYAFESRCFVEECGYIAHPTIPNCGASPDGLIGDEGLWEGKCPQSMTKHLHALFSGAHAVEYKWQLQHQLFVTGRKWVDASSYDPRFPEGLRLATVRVYRDEKMISDLADEIARAEKEVKAIVAELESKKETLQKQTNYT